MGTAVAIPAILSAVGSATAGAGAIQQNRESKKRQRAAQAQAQQQLAVQQQENRAAEEDRQQELRKALATQRAVFAQRNVGLGSGTPSVLSRRAETETAREGALAASRNALNASRTGTGLGGGSSTLGLAEKLTRSLLGITRSF